MRDKGRPKRDKGRPRETRRDKGRPGQARLWKIAGRPWRPRRFR